MTPYAAQLEQYANEERYPQTAHRYPQQTLGGTKFTKEVRKKTRFNKASWGKAPSSIPKSSSSTNLLAPSSSDPHSAQPLKCSFCPIDSEPTCWRDVPSPSPKKEEETSPRAIARSLSNLNAHPEKKVTFDRVVRVILIPTKKELHKERLTGKGLTGKLWWGQSDYDSIKDDTIKEITKYEEKHGVSRKVAIRELYQPKEPLFV